MIRTTHLNQERFKEQAEKETRHILDQAKRESEVSRLRDMYLLKAMDDPIMRADAHPYRIRKLMPGEIEVIPFIFIIGNMGETPCSAADSEFYGEPWQNLFATQLRILDGKVYFTRHGDIYFGFPTNPLEDSLRRAAIVYTNSRKWNSEPDIMRMMTLAEYRFDDIVQEPSHPWPDDRLDSFTSSTRLIAFEDYMRRFPDLMPCSKEQSQDDSYAQ